MANKRIMKKRAISKAAAQAKVLNAEQLLAEVSRLQLKNKTLVKQLEQLKQKDVQNQKTINKLRSQIRQNQAVNRALSKKVIRTQKTMARLKRVRLIKERKITSTFGKPKSVKMSLAESMTLRKPLFVSRFIQRILETFGDVDINKLQQLQEYLLGLNWSDVSDIIKYCDLEKAYYESDSYSFADEYQTFDKLFDDIMAFQYSANEELVDDYDDED